jgi:hypothetical protein
MKNNRYLKLIGALQETVSILDYRIPLYWTGEAQPYFSCIVSDKDNLSDFRAHLTVLEDDFWEEVEENLGKIKPTDQPDYLHKIKGKIAEIINEQTGTKRANLETITRIARSRLEEKGDLPEVRFEEEPGEFMIAQIKKLHSIYEKVKARIDMISDSQQPPETTNPLPFVSGSKIDWKDQLNILTTLFYELHEEGYITTQRADLERWLVANFTHKGKELKPATINTNLRPDKPEKRTKSRNKIVVPKRPK